MHRCLWHSVLVAFMLPGDQFVDRHAFDPARKDCSFGAAIMSSNADRRAAVWASGTGRATGQFSQWMTISSPASARVMRSGRRAFISAIFTAHVRSPSALERVHIPTLWSQRHAGPSILPKRLRRQNPESNNQAFFFIALTIKPTTAVTIAPVMPPPAS